MRIKNYEQNTLSLENFEGPLAFLHYLVQKSEIDISDVSMREITEQYLKYLMEVGLPDLNAGADFIDHTGALIWLKSKMLLPAGITEEDLEELDLSAPFDIIPQLLEYCKFKDIAKELTKREDGNEGKFPRGFLPTAADFPAPSGIERISLDELEELFQRMLEKAEYKKPEKIREEEWRVADKIETLRALLKANTKILFRTAFSDAPNKVEVVVTFLSMLELMKIGELVVYKEEGSEEIFLSRGGEHE